MDVNVYTKYVFSKKIMLLDYVCDCVIGSRTINADSHIMAALMYIYYWCSYIKVPDSMISETKYCNLYDINHWKSVFRNFNDKQLFYFAKKFCKQHQRNNYC